MSKVFALMLVATLAGCGTAGPLPEDNHYRLGAAAPASWTLPSLGEALVVDPFRAPGILDGRAMAYSDDPTGLALRTYVYHAWVASPPQMSRQHFLSALQASGVADAVTSQSASKTALRVTGQVLAFHRQRSGNAWNAEVSLRLQLVDPQRDLPLLASEYSAVEEALGTEVSATAAAFTRALDGVVDEFVRDLQALEVAQ